MKAFSKIIGFGINSKKNCYVVKQKNKQIRLQLKKKKSTQRRPENTTAETL